MLQKSLVLGFRYTRYLARSIIVQIEKNAAKVFIWRLRYLTENDFAKSKLKIKLVYF